MDSRLINGIGFGDCPVGIARLLALPSLQTAVMVLGSACLPWLAGRVA